MDLDFSEGSFGSNGPWWSSKFANKYFTVKADEIDNRTAGYLGSKDNVKDELGVFLQTLKATALLGKKVKVSAKVKSKDIKDWAGIWFRTNDVDGKTLTFDNMQKTAIKGTLDWHEVSFNIDVPQSAHVINFGTVMEGTGHLWVDGIEITSIGKAKIIEAKKEKKQKALPLTATNLDFE